MFDLLGKLEACEDLLGSRREDFSPVPETLGTFTDNRWGQDGKKETSRRPCMAKAVAMQW